MNQRIHDDYINTRHPTAFTSPGKIKKYNGARYGTTPILETLKGIDGYTLHREFHKPRVTNPFYVYKKRQQIQMDLIDVSKLKEHNDGITFLLVAIDCFTKHAWVRPLEKKNANVSCAAIKSIIESRTMIKKPESIFFDKGTEFKNRQVSEYLNSQDIKMVHPYSDKKAAIVERFNKTLQGRFYRFLTQNKTKRYIDELPNLLYAYNSSGHRTLEGLSPFEAEMEENQARLLAIHNARYTKLANKRKKPKYHVGEKVLVKNLSTNRFQRGYQRSFRREQFEIVEVKTNMPIPMYIIKSLDDGEVILGGFYAEELQPIRGDNYSVEVIKRRTVRGQKQLFVRWVGYSDKHNQWINEEDITGVYNLNPS